MVVNDELGAYLKNKVSQAFVGPLVAGLTHARRHGDLDI
jgi:hypothetical protein